jgi:2,5-furandicarboxylate decarboxylase 1
MPDQSFRTMLANLEQQGEMIRFTKQVDPETNMAALQWRAYNEMGKASLFTNIAGHDGWQACSQIVADRRKWAIGLGIGEDQLLGEIGARFGAEIAPDTVDAAGAPVKQVKITGADVDLPAIFYAAAFTTDFGRDELALAGGLLGEPVRMVPCETNDLEVPAEAELVLEGEVPTDLMEPEGPYGEVTGTYNAGGISEVFQVKAITRRSDPIFYALHCGAPVTDAQSTMALGIEVATKQHLSTVEGGIDLIDVRSVTASGDMMLVLKLRPRQPGQAKTALMAALSGPYLHPKLAIAVDEDIDAADLRQISWSMVTRVHASEDVTMIPNTRVFGLDSISPNVPGFGQYTRLGTKWLIDATLPVNLSEEERQEFMAAYPKNYASVRLEDFLP